MIDLPCEHCGGLLELTLPDGRRSCREGCTTALPETPLNAAAILLAALRREPRDELLESIHLLSMLSTCAPSEQRARSIRIAKRSAIICLALVEAMDKGLLPSLQSDELPVAPPPRDGRVRPSSPRRPNLRGLTFPAGGQQTRSGA